MKEFSDSRTAQVARFGFARGVPDHIARKANRFIWLLKASESLTKDVGKLADLEHWPGRSSNAHGIRVEEKWCVTFDWDDHIFATNILLERR
jgi:plasmid maintenance system killer protein